ncbi:MAG: ABC transporter substrate-binding protein [Rhodospirillaceae bacterium]|nr:ABC transporter substrate-binding protein [Rhodospirillaceae bacterium]
MRIIRTLLPILIGLVLVVAGPGAPQAETPMDLAAARYIRALFSATLPTRGQAAGLCPEVEAFGRFAAGRLWHDLTDDERRRFARDFCALASDAVARVHATYPGLTLSGLEAVAAPQQMTVVHSWLNRPQSEPWPVDWQMAGMPDRPHLADLRILGVSLGIFLRSVAMMRAAPIGPSQRTAASILDPWRQALDRALPPQPGSPPR